MAPLVADPAFHDAPRSSTRADTMQKAVVRPGSEGDLVHPPQGLDGFVVEFVSLSTESLLYCSRYYRHVAMEECSDEQKRIHFFFFYTYSLLICSQRGL